MEITKVALPLQQYIAGMPWQHIVPLYVYIIEVSQWNNGTICHAKFINKIMLVNCYFITEEFLFV